MGVLRRGRTVPDGPSAALRSDLTVFFLLLPSFTELRRVFLVKAERCHRPRR